MITYIIYIMYIYHQSQDHEGLNDKQPSVMYNTL